MIQSSYFIFTFGDITSDEALKNLKDTPFKQLLKMKISW
jgi:hypothetical protein